MLVDRSEVLANGVLPPPLSAVTQRPLMRQAASGGFFKSRRHTLGDVPSEQIATKADELKGPMMLSLFEHFFFSPFGVNTFLVGPPTLKAMKKMAVHIGFLGSLTRIKSTPRGLSRRHSGTAITNGIVLRWMQLAVMDSLRLAQIVEMTLSMKNAVNADKSQRSLMSDTMTRLKYEMGRVKFRKNQFEREYQRAIVTALAESNDPCEASVLSCQFAYTFLDSQLEVAQAALSWIENQMTRRFRLFLLSFAGLFTPMALFFASMISPWIHGLKRILRVCVKSLQNAQSPDTSFVLSNARISRNSPRSPFPMHLKSLRDFQRFVTWPSTTLRLQSRERKHGLTEAHSFWICTRFAIGSTFLLALVILTPSYSEKKWLGGESESPLPLPGLPADFVQFSVPVLHIAKTAAWTFLGFLTTFICTLEGTIKRAMLRMIGVVTGSGMAWLCLLAFPRSGIAQCIWMVVVDFIVVWISVNPNSPFGGFHPSWGYSAQLFTYQQAIIVCETTILAPKYNRNEITVDRLLSQTIGITTAVALSVIVFPSRAGPTVRLYLSDSVYSMSQTTRALIELFSVPKAVHTLDSNTVERKNAESWRKYYESYSTYFRSDIDTANRYRVDNSILTGFAPLKNHPALDVIYSSCQRLVIIREEAYETLKSLWTATQEANDGQPLETERQLEMSSHTISLYADQPNSAQQEEYPMAWQTPRDNKPSSRSATSTPRDIKTGTGVPSFQPSPMHRASPPDDRFLHARLPGSAERGRAVTVERGATPISAFSIAYDMTSCGVQTGDGVANRERLPSTSSPGSSAIVSRQTSLKTTEYFIGRIVLAERDAATRESERLREENLRRQQEAEQLAQRVKELEAKLAEKDTRPDEEPPILLTREQPKLSPGHGDGDGHEDEDGDGELNEFLDRLMETRRWIVDEGDDERYAQSLAAMVLVFERLYVILENGLQFGGRKQRSSFPLLSSEFEEICVKALSWLKEMNDEIASRAATEIALIDPQVSSAHRPSPTAARDAYKMYCDKLAVDEDERCLRILEVAYRMRGLTHFLTLEIIELNRLVHLITSELWDKARLRSSKTVKSDRL